MLVAVLAPSLPRSSLRKANAFDNDTLNVLPRVAVVIIGIALIIGVGILLLSVFNTATANAVQNPQPGTLAYNLTMPVIKAGIQFANFLPTDFLLLGVVVIAVLASAIIWLFMEKFKTG